MDMVSVFLDNPVYTCMQEILYSVVRTVTDTHSRNDTDRKIGLYIIQTLNVLKTTLEHAGKCCV